MDARHSQQKSRRFLYLSASLVLSILVFEGGAEVQKAERQVRVKVTAYGFCGEGGVPLAGVEVNAGGSATTGADGSAMISVSPGKHNVTATAKGFNITGVGWHGSWVQEDGVELPPDAAGGYCSTRSVEAEFKGPPENVAPSGDYDEELSVSLVCDRGCKETEKQKENAAKEIALTAASEDCKDFDWSGSKISFSPPGGGGIPISMLSEFPEFSLNKYGLAQNKTELRPGTYAVSFHHPSLETGAGGIPITKEETEKYIGLAKISKVEVYRAFQKRELVGTYPADEKGYATVTLDNSLWKDNNVPYVKVYVERLCDLRFATIEFFQGQVDVALNVEGFKSEPQPAQAGMELFKKDLIKIGPGSSVQLKSQGGIYLIRISVPKDAQPAHLNIGTVITAEGRKFIEASTDSTVNIEVQRVVVAPPPQPMPDNNALPEPMPVDVKTPTLTTTDKQTNYMVSYDEKTNTTTVGVEEGEVEITPTNSSLKPVTLAANQQVEVTEKSVSAITSYSGSGSKTGRVLLYVGIGVVSLLALVAMLFFFRRQHRLAMQPAYFPTGVNPAGWNAPTANVVPPVVENVSQKCPNPQCGKDVPADKEFCAHCGTRLT
ncbi:MAG: hypothetical protein QOC96_788 [Acidobacteriota bacterium]|jgi:hypothetical protein|nr:hypothetical protein [Acidobacteriota bacterium]